MLLNPGVAGGAEAGLYLSLEVENDFQSALLAVSEYAKCFNLR